MNVDDFTSCFLKRGTYLLDELLIKMIRPPPVLEVDLINFVSFLSSIWTYCFSLLTLRYYSVHSVSSATTRRYMIGRRRTASAWPPPVASLNPAFPTGTYSRAPSLSCSTSLWSSSSRYQSFQPFLQVIILHILLLWWNYGRKS